jgi:SAM-dependent methyltransferase
MGEGVELDAASVAAPPRAALEAGGMSGVLHLGCGRQYMKGAVNVDISPNVGADVVHDLASMPWPLPSDAFREVHAFDVIEHLDDILRSMEEIHRVCEPGARVLITVPHFSSPNTFTDPTHRHQFSVFSFDYFGDAHALAFYSKARFACRRAEIVFHPSLLNKVVRRLANRRPAAYERRWAWMFPAWFLSVELEALK